MNQIGRRYAGLDVDERKAQRRQKFIDAGIEIFGTEGYHSATVRKLCAEAGLTARYYYESFDSNEDVLVAAFDQCMDGITQHIVAVLMDAGLNTEIPDLVRILLDKFFEQMQDKRVARVLMLEVLGVSENVDQLSNKSLLKLGSLILMLGQRFHPDWTIDEKEGVLLSVSIMGAVRQATLHWISTDFELSREAVVSTTSMLIFGLLKMIEEQTSANQKVD